MRIISYSVLAVAALGAWELRNTRLETQQVAGIEAPHGVDYTVIGETVSADHAAKWETRNRIQKVSSGPRVYFQAFPDDVEAGVLGAGEDEMMAGKYDMMPTASVKKSKPLSSK